MRGRGGEPLRADAPAATPRTEDATGAPSGAYPWFLGGALSWFGAWGMQAVLFSWLVVGELRVSAEWVGVAQTSAMLPSLLFLLVGGATADRSDPRRMLIWLHVIGVLPILALAAAVRGEWLGLPGLIAFGACIGTISAFAMPARDTLLSRVAGPDLMRAVTGLTAAQFGAQAAGTLLAGLARWIGSAPALLGQAGLLLLGSLAMARVPPAPPQARAHRRLTLQEIGGGLAAVARTPALRGPIVLVMSVGFLFVGPFLVTFPLLVRDFYHGDIDDLSLVLMQFPLGTIAGSLALLARGSLRHKGRAALIALACGSAALGAVGLGLPFAGMVLAAFVWGLSGSVFINSSRTIYQEAAPVAQRARVLAVYQLGFMGASPLGALTAGFVSARLGALGTLLAFAGGMLLVVVVMATCSDVARME